MFDFFCSLYSHPYSLHASYHNYVVILFQIVGINSKKVLMSDIKLFFKQTEAKNTKFCSEEAEISHDRQIFLHQILSKDPNDSYL
jgi:hypothetical protein